jgi:ParB family chromosome partitioning protein
METPLPSLIESIPVDHIRILNPRARSKRQHQAIIENIASVGLKKPITVTRRAGEGNGDEYDLVCGQGRLEAVQLLGHVTIPARIVDKAEAECLMMSLVENIARRNHTQQELLRDIQNLRQSGYTDDIVAGKVGLAPAYLESLLFLLDRGEERLIAAVDSGAIPIAVAIHIARAESADVQSALVDAYTDGTLNAKQLAVVRRLLERRGRPGGRTLPKSGPHDGPPRARELAPEQLKRMYMRESDRQRVLAKKVDVTHARLSFIVHGLRQLLKDEEFVSLLSNEGLNTIPRILEQRIRAEGQSWTN